MSTITLTGGTASQAVKKGLPFLRIHQPLTTEQSDWGGLGGDSFNLDAAFVAAYVGPDSDFDQYCIGNLASFNGTVGSQDRFSVKSPLGRLINDGAPGLVLGGTGYTLGFLDRFNLTVQPFILGFIGTDYQVPMVDVYLWLVPPPVPPFARRRKLFSCNPALELPAGVETTVLLLPTWGRRQLVITLPANEVSDVVYNVYGWDGDDSAIVRPAVATVFVASTDPPDEINIPYWGASSVLVTATPVDDTVTGRITAMMQD